MHQAVPSPRPALIFLLTLLASVLTFVARAQSISARPLVIPAAGAMSEPDTPVEIRSAHAWSVLFDGDGRDGQIVHLPPRDPAYKVHSGTLRAVTPLLDRPHFMAAVGSTLYLAWPQRVHYLSAEALPGVGNWGYKHHTDLATAPALPKGATIRDLSGTPLGPAVLLDHVPDAHRLMLLWRNRWHTLAMPAGVGEGPIWLAQSTTGLWLVARSPEGDTLRMWHTPLAEPDSKPVPRAPITGPPAPRSPLAKSPPSEPVPEFGTFANQWIEQAPTPIPPALATDLGFARLISTGKNLALAHHHSKSKLSLWTLEPGQLRPLATLDNIAELYSVFPIAGPELATVIWVTPSANPQSNKRVPAGSPLPEPISPQRIEIREVSLRTGRVMYSGHQSGTQGPISPGDFHLLTLLMGCAIAGVLLFVMRTEQKFQPILPAGASLAHPGKRLAAWVFDFIPAVILSGALFSATPGQVIAGLAMHDSMVDALPFFAAIAIALLHSAIMEHTTGASLGKMLMGLSVIAYQRRPAAASTDSTAPATGSVEITRPLLWQAFSRGLIRWCLFPLGATILFDPNTRHAGDMLARTLVVEITPEPSADDSE